jgi:hypothetical protein
LVGDRLREDVILRNLGAEPVGVTLSLAVDTDFADLFAVKEGRVQPPHGLAVDIGTASMAFTFAGPDYTRGVQITAATGDPIVTPGRFTFRIVVPQRSRWSTCPTCPLVPPGCARNFSNRICFSGGALRH